MKKEIRIASDEELRKSSVIIGLSFGSKRKDGSPGLSNRRLANITASLYGEYQLPIILQWEIADSLDFLGATLPIYRVISEHQDNEKKYLDTYEVLRQAKAICKNNGWERIILVAHQDHLPRSIKVAEKIGFIVNVPSIKCFLYDKESAQKWTRSKFRFAIREKFVKIVYSFESKI